METVMPKCKACESLVGADQSTPAHAALKQTAQREYKSIGWHTGSLRNYVCGDCGAKWMLDIDKQDAHAGWAEDNA